MTRLITSNIGSYPRIGDQKDQQRHRRGLTHYQNQDISAHAYRDVEQSVIQELIREQIEAGLDEVTDGLVSWQDPISHFCSKLSGFETNALLRYFDTNFYYRVPVITGMPKRKAALILPEFLYAKSLSSRPIRTVLTGPYTLASHTRSTLKSFDKKNARLAFFTEFLADEIKALVKEGALIIQIDEPSLAQNPADLPLVKKAFQTLSAQVKPAKLVLALYFYPLSEIYDQLADFPVDVLQLDFTYDGKKLFEKILKGPSHLSIGLGLLNSRNTRIEAIDPLLKTVSQWMDKTTAPVTYVTPSAGLEFLPRESALAKLKLLSKVKSECRGHAPTTNIHV